MPYRLLVESLGDPALESRYLRWVPNDTHRIQMNDTAYILANIDGLVEDYIERYKTE